MAHLEEHYADLAKKPFFPGLVKYMASGPVVAMVWEGLNAVKTGKNKGLSWCDHQFNELLHSYAVGLSNYKKGFTASSCLPFHYIFICGTR